MPAECLTELASFAFVNSVPVVRKLADKLEAGNKSLHVGIAKSPKHGDLSMDIIKVRSLTGLMRRENCTG